MYKVYDKQIFLTTVTILIQNVPTLKILYVYKQVVIYFISVIISVLTCNV